MNGQPESEIALLKRKLWRIGVIADALERRLLDKDLMRNSKLRDKVIEESMKQILSEITRPLGRQKRDRTPKAARS